MNFSPSFSLFVRVAPFLALGLLGISSSAAGCASDRGDNVTSESLDENGYGGYGGGYGGYGGGNGGGAGGNGGGGGEGNVAGGGGGDAAGGGGSAIGVGGPKNNNSGNAGGDSGCSASASTGGFSSSAPLLGLATLGIAAALRRRRERGAP